MHIQKSIRSLIQKEGCTISAPDGKSWRALIHPLQYRNKLYVEEVSVPAGMINRTAYFYIGLPENDPSVYPRGTLFTFCGELLSLTHTETVRFQDKAEYIWAVFNLYGTVSQQEADA